MREQRKVRPFVPVPIEPLYELRISVSRKSEALYGIWQLPSPATPHLERPRKIAKIRGRNLEIIRLFVHEKLLQAGVPVVSVVNGKDAKFPIPEELAVTFGLLFRTLSPMRSLHNIQLVVEGIEAMRAEEQAYWLGMAMYREHEKRNVYRALRALFTDSS